jgi:hypothetical protein
MKYRMLQWIENAVRMEDTRILVGHLLENGHLEDGEGDGSYGIGF